MVLVAGVAYMVQEYYYDSRAEDDNGHSKTHAERMRSITQNWKSWPGTAGSSG